MRERLLVAILILIVAVCEIADMVSKIVRDCFSHKKST